MVKILAACGAGVNSSHQIKSALESELKKRSKSNLSIFSRKF